MFLTVVDRVIQFCLTKGRYAFTNQIENQVSMEKMVGSGMNNVLDEMLGHIFPN
jgi:hypothetical protein